MTEQKLIKPIKERISKNYWNFDLIKIYRGSYGIYCLGCGRKFDFIKQENPNLYLCYCSKCKAKHQIIIKNYPFFTKREVRIIQKGFIPFLNYKLK